KAYGNKQVYPTKEAMTTNTVFDLASVSKSVSTAISAMILIERGQLRLVDKVSLFIPEFEKWVSNDGSGRTKAITIQDLMTHSSGLPPYVKDIKKVAKKYGAPNPDGVIDYISHCPRDFEPETDFQYSCLNFITLQRVIETISGLSLRDFAKQNIFDKLGMLHTDYNPTGETLERCAPTEVQKDGKPLKGIVHDPLARIMNGGISGNAGVFSDADDLAILATALINKGVYQDKRILSPLTVECMTHVPRSVATLGRTPGWDKFTAYASNIGDLLSKETYGHTGYTGTSIVIDPANKLAIILLTNRAHPKDGGTCIRLRSFVANAVASAVVPVPRIYTPHYYERCVAFEKEAPITSNDIVMLGNSLTENGGDWSKWLNKKNVVNRGIRGDVAMGLYDRLDQILPGHPKKIFILTGANDVSHDLSSDTIVAHIGKLVDRIQLESPTTEIYLQSVLPINESFHRYKRLTNKTAQFPEINEKLVVLAAKKGVTFINLFPLYVAEDGLTMRKEVTRDGLHIIQREYKKWGKALQPYLN
ncbi:MAG: serine hydrolase, partial [Bacteroidaceae bacterium]|nr:serine hydrolase [Bacteroidaceae bacterium]